MLSWGIEAAPAELNPPSTTFWHMSVPHNYVATTCAAHTSCDVDTGAGAAHTSCDVSFSSIEP